MAAGSIIHSFGGAKRRFGSGRRRSFKFKRVDAFAATADLVRGGADAGDIVLRTSAESWFEVAAPDGTSVEKGLLPAGSERRYGAAQVGRLTIGNASAVRLESQGRTVDLAPFARANVARFAVSSDGSLVAAD